MTNISKPRRGNTPPRINGDSIITAEGHLLVLDVGGTNVIAGLVKHDGQVLTRRVFPTNSSRGPAMVIDDIVANLKEIRDQAPAGCRPEALVVGMPGWISPGEGILIKAPNMPGWENVPMAEIMGRALDMPVKLDNDSNLYALGEWLCGAGQGISNLLVITLGTGVGGGLLLENRLWNGSFASSVEIGHTPVKLEGDLCGCGRRGCLETLASATGMSRMARQWLADGKPSLYQGPPQDLNPKVMAELAAKGDEMALSIFDEAGRALGLVLVSTLNILGLEAIVIGGGAAGAFDYISPALWRVITERLIVTDPANIKLVKGILGEDAPLAGGAALVRMERGGLSGEGPPLLCPAL
ncbi:ROK family protein [Deltaproteobacteria bacterium OttesenSCG-928-K17]|nr:ROK family protein [Deltaproteobacteria bacterium OttesenSCG-928-K17]